jgi:hypothetical protein
MWFGYAPFARHRLGYLTGSLTSYLRVTDARYLPARTVQLPRAPSDLVVASGGNAIYLTDPVDPVIRVLRPATFEVVETIPLAAPAMGVDISISGDSLLVAHWQERAISVIALKTGARTIVPLVMANPPHPFFDTNDLRQLRVVGAGHVLQTIASGTGGYLFDVDLVTGALVSRSIWFSGSAFERSQDRSRAYTDALSGLTYVAATNTFIPLSGAGLTQLPGPVVDVELKRRRCSWGAQPSPVTSGR